MERPHHHATPAALATQAQGLVAHVASLEGRLAELAAEVEASRRLAHMGTLAAALAHEFNNLLTPVLSYAQLAQSRPNDPLLRDKALARVVGGLGKATTLAGSVLALARECGTEPPEPARAACDVAHAVREAADFINAADRVVVECEADLKAAIEPLALHQVVLNLLLNALARADHVCVRAVIEPCSTWNTRIRISVQDNGPGVDPLLIPRLFDPFTRGDASASTRTASTGLGLMISKRLIEHAGGSIHYQPAHPKGACFVLLLRDASSAATPE